MNFSFEAYLAWSGLIDFNAAIQRFYLTRTRLELAKPYSVIVLGHLDGWMFRDGHLVYPLGDLIRILDVYNAAVTEHVIDVRSVLSEAAKSWPEHHQRIQEFLSDKLDIRILGFADGFLMFGIHDFKSLRRDPPGYMVVINVREGVPLQERLLKILECRVNDCEVLSDGRYMILFDYPIGNAKLELYDLEDKLQRMERRHLPRFTRRGRSDRTIYDGWYYLLTDYHPNEDGDTFDYPYGEYYYCYRFPLNQFSPVTSYGAAGVDHLPEQLQVVRVKRQQLRYHSPYSDYIPTPWSSLELCRDEHSGQLVIVEGWHHGGGEDDAANAQYTFQPLQFPEPDSAIDSATPAEAFFSGDSVFQTLDSADLPRAEKDCECPRDPGERLKARIYVPRASTFPGHLLSLTSTLVPTKLQTQA